MKHALWLSLFSLLSGLFLMPAVYGQATATVTGTVTDAQDGQPLSGASVALMTPSGSNMAGGAATDVDGRYRIAGVRPGTYTLRVSFIGYQIAETPVTLSAGETETLNFALEQGGFDLNTVVVTASRQPEKVLDAPASISVLGTQEIETQATGLSSSSVLRNVTGIDMASTGIDRQEIVLRGFNNAFSGATYVLTDYRQSAVPSLGVNVFSIMPNAAIDLERVEVVRGPGSALYGAGVDAGVIHFITKDPFTYPGTTVSVAGGERSAFSGDLRHAGVVGERLGYKIVGSYARADDWELDPSDPLDQAQLASDRVQRNYDYQKYGVSGQLQYRFTPRTTLTANAGFSALTATVLSGIGTLQADDFGYTYGQLRLQSGNFFAQAYVNRNNAGNSLVYGSGQTVVDKSNQLNAQAQYNLGLADGRQQFIFGLDADITNPETEGTILGRNEDETIQEYGAYVQSTTGVTSKLDLTLALRGDYNNIVDEVQVSPRAAAVYRITPQHSARATYNRAFSSPGTNSLFLDIVAGQLPGTPILLRGRGAGFGFHFRRDQAFEALAGSDLVASSLNPATLGADQPVGLPITPVYASIHASLVAIPSAVLAQQLSAQLGRPFSPQHIDMFKQLLAPGQTNVTGFSRGALAVLNPTTRGLDPIADVEDVAPLKQTTSQTFELGYKGLFGNRVLFSVDAYYTQKQNFIGPLVVETPFVLVPNLSPDLMAALVAGINNNAQLRGALSQFQLTPEQVAAVIVGLAQQSPQFPDKPGFANDLPVAIVQPTENNPGVGQAPELLLSYRNYGEIEYYGADVAMQVMLTDRLDVFGNLSFVSDDFFQDDEIGEEEGAYTDLAVALNAPTLKAKTGFAYTIPRGLSFNASARYTEGFPVRSGPYVGEVESYGLIDVGVGYDFSRTVPGLRADLTIMNLLDADHREFVGAPEIGRLALLRLTYSL